MGESLSSAWRSVPGWARNTAALFAFILVLLVPAWAGRAFKSGEELYLLVAFIGLLLIGKPLYALFWRVLESAGVSNGRRRWGRQPRWIRALPLAAAIGLGLLIVWGRGTQPSPTLLILLAIVFSLYIVPPRVRQFVIPVTALAIAVLYPILYAKDWLFGESVPIFNTLPSMDTMVVMSVYVMMALGLNMVVGYAGLLDLGYVAFFAIGAYSAAWFASPHFARPDIATGLPSIDFNFGAVGVFPGVGGIHISIWLVLLIGAAITAVAGVVDRVADAAAARRLPRHRHARLRRDGRADRPERRRGRPRLQPHERSARHQPHRFAGVRGLAPRHHRPAVELPHGHGMVRS